MISVRSTESLSVNVVSSGEGKIMGVGSKHTACLEKMMTFHSVFTAVYRSPSDLSLRLTVQLYSDNKSKSTHHQDPLCGSFDESHLNRTLHGRKKSVAAQEF